MKQGQTVAQPNYVQKLHDLYRIGALPREVGLHMVTIYHDAWCDMYQGKRCNCDPDITLTCSLSGHPNEERQA